MKLKDYLFYQDDWATIYCGDCLEVMPLLKPYFDLIFCDLPYEQTASSWDKQIPMNRLWEEYDRIIHQRSIIILTAAQPFSSFLVMGRPGMFRYEWIWVKNRPTGFPSAKYKPLVNHEHVLIFSKYSIDTYNPQKTTGHIPTSSARGKSKHTIYYGKFNVRNYAGKDTTRLPLTVQYFKSERGFHPNQKPISLCIYFLKTYSAGNKPILDNAMGSGTTCVAAKNLNRKSIGIEINPDYCEIAVKRLRQEVFDFR